MRNQILLWNNVYRNNNNNAQIVLKISETSDIK